MTHRAQSRHWKQTTGLLPLCNPAVVLAMVERLARLNHLVKASKQLVLAEADSSPTGAFRDAIDWVIKETKDLG